jgi:hypothetical protein
MKNLQQVLYEKEMALARVRQEVEALRFVAPMLMEQTAGGRASVDSARPETEPKNRWPLDVTQATRAFPG